MWFRVSRASSVGEGDTSFDGEVSAANLNVRGILLSWLWNLSSAVCSVPRQEVAWKEARIRGRSVFGGQRVYFLFSCNRPSSLFAQNSESIISIIIMFMFWTVY